MYRYLFYSFIFFIPIQAAADLRECERHFQANRLTSGNGGTAFDCYNKILVNDPTNAGALNGLKKIEDRYVGWAERALARGQRSRVKRYLDSLRLVNPNSQALADLEGELYPNRNTETPPQEVDSPSQEIEQPTPQKKAQIVDVGQIYEAINTTDCLTWSSPKVKEKGGKNGWGNYYPKGGEIGIVVDEVKHCRFDNSIYLLQIGLYYVPISSVGVQIIE